MAFGDVPTPHIGAQKGEIASIVLAPGDPLRAKTMAETFLENPKLVSSVRNAFAFTGTYKGVPVTIMGCGMGIASASIYYHELFAFYGVEIIVRIGSAGAVLDDVHVNDIIVASGASTDSSCNRIRFGQMDLAPIADFDLLFKCAKIAEQENIKIRVGNIFSSDCFYRSNPEVFQLCKKYQMLGIEMEAAGLYAIAAELGKKALCVCTISDHIFTGEELDSEKRQNSFTEMVKLTLETVIAK